MIADASRGDAGSGAGSGTGSGTGSGSGQVGSGLWGSRPYLTAPDHDRLSGLVTEVKKMLGALRRKLMADG